MRTHRVFRAIQDCFFRILYFCKKNKTWKYSQKKFPMKVSMPRNAHAASKFQNVHIYSSVFKHFCQLFWRNVFSLVFLLSANQFNNEKLIVTEQRVYLCMDYYAICISCVIDIILLVWLILYSLCKEVQKISSKECEQINKAKLFTDKFPSLKINRHTKPNIHV